METWNLVNTVPVYGLLIDGTMAQPCVDLSSMWSYGIDMKAISQEMLKISGVKLSLHHTDCSLFNLGTHYIRCYTTADCTYADYLLKVIIPALPLPDRLIYQRLFYRCLCRPVHFSTQSISIHYVHNRSKYNSSIEIFSLLWFCHTLEICLW